MKKRDMQEWAKECHSLAKEKGFWEEDRNPAEVIALIHSEVSELLEAFRKEPKAYCGKEGCALNKAEEEIADILIRTFDLCGRYGIDPDFAVTQKHNYNKNRPHKHGKKF